jgi:hypothetical protein
LAKAELEELSPVEVQAESKTGRESQKEDPVASAGLLYFRSGILKMAEAAAQGEAA